MVSRVVVIVLHCNLSRHPLVIVTLYFLFQQEQMGHAPSSRRMAFQPLTPPKESSHEEV